MGEDTPNEENGKELRDFLSQFAGNEDNAQFFAQIEDPMTQAFVGFHEMYNGLQAGGFTKYEALMVVGVTLHQTMSSTEGDE